MTRRQEARRNIAALIRRREDLARVATVGGGLTGEEKGELRALTWVLRTLREITWAWRTLRDGVPGAADLLRGVDLTYQTGGVADRARGDPRSRDDRVDGDGQLRTSHLTQ